MNGDNQTGDHRHDDDAELRRVLAGLTEQDLHPPTPPANIWDTIENAISDRSATGAHPTTDRSGGTRPDADPNPAVVTPIDSPVRHGRGRTYPRWLRIAAAFVLGMAGIGIWAMRRGEQAKVIAVADLRYEPTFDAAGSRASARARLVSESAGFQIQLVDAMLPRRLDEPADLELWLIRAKPDGSLDVRPVSVISSGDGTYPVPDGIDPVTHNIVDISIEPRDGDSTHSGRSILRGPLDRV